MAMKLLIMSDTHGDAEVIREVRDYHTDVETIIHCGDSELPYDHPYLDGVYKVRGNCDRDERYPTEQIIQINDTKIFVTHGHLFNVKSSVLSLTYRAEELGAMICCFGHSHLLGAELIEGILFINPGSLLKPRGRKEKTYVVVEIKEHAYFVNCYSNNHVLLECVQLKR